MRDARSYAVWNQEGSETAPAFPPKVITVEWAWGDALTVDYDDAGLAPWEVAAALRRAAALMEEDDEDDPALD